MSNNTRNSNTLPWLVVTVMACLLVIMSFGHLLHDGSEGGGNTPAPQREGLIRWVIRVASEAIIHRAIRGEMPPSEPEAQPVRSLAEANLYQTLPVIPPSQFLVREGDRLEHGEGW